MSLELSVVTGGLVFEVTPTLDPQEIKETLTPVMNRLGHPIESASALGAFGVQLRCGDLLLWLNKDTPAYGAPRIRLTANPIAESSEAAQGKARTTPSTDMIKAIMAESLAALAETLGAVQVQWLSKDVVISTADFVATVIGGHDDATAPLAQDTAQALVPAAAQSHVAPRRVRTRPATTPRPVKASKDGLATAVSSHLAAMYATEEKINESLSDGTSLPLRLTAWAMTLMIAVFSVPLAWVIFAFNLNRGGDFATTTRVLAAVGGLAILHANGGTEILFGLLF